MARDTADEGGVLIRAVASLVVAFLIAVAGFSVLVRPVRAAGQALFQPPYTATGVDQDFPPDGKFDLLIVGFSLNVSMGGEFIVWVDFPGIGLIDDWYMLDPGVHEIQFPVLGSWIREKGLDGPYTLSLQIENMDYVVTDTKSFVTPAFLAIDFVGHPVDFDGMPSDQPIDTDVPSNGLYDYVAIDVPIKAYAAGDYSLLLSYSGGSYIYNSTRLQPGPHTVRLLIPGFEVWEGRTIGPLWVQITLERSGVYQVTEPYQTNPYNWAGFEPTPAYVEPSGSDAGVDTSVPPDGRYDYLSVKIPLYVNVTGDYRVEANLRSQTGSNLGQTSNTTYLTAGHSTAELAFGSVAISANQEDGPYTVLFWVTDWRDRDIGQGSYTTAAYSWALFDPAPIWSPGPVVDEYRDTDQPPDGVVDEYVAKVPLIVNVSGTYLFRAVASGMKGQALSLNMTPLSVGTASVELSWSIWSFAPDGQPLNQSAFVAVAGIGGVGLFEKSFVPSPMPNGTRIAPTAVSITGDPETFLPDLDSDGLFDSLVVEANVSATRGNPYTFSGMLLSVTNNLRVTYTVNHTVLSIGQQQVRLVFPGWAIRQSLLDGPYMVFLFWHVGHADDTGISWWYIPEHHYSYTPVLSYRQFDNERPSISAGWTPTPPIPDGIIATSEWLAATQIDLVTQDTGGISAKAYVANDARNLYVALDATGDKTRDEVDAAALSFDIMNLDDMDQGTDDQIGAGLAWSSGTSSFRATVGYDSMQEGFWMRQSPLDNAPPRANLSAIAGFGQSPGYPMPHRMYEFRIPLSLLRVSPGQTIGFAVFSTRTPGIVDAAGKTHTWPVAAGRFDEFGVFNYARLTLAGGPQPQNRPPSVTVSSPANDSFVSGTTRVSGGSSDPDGTVERVELRVDDSLWKNATGTTSWTYDIDTTALVDGDHNVSARAYDGKNYSVEAKLAIVVDNTAPSVTISLPVEGAVLKTREVAVTWRASDLTSGLLSYEVRLDYRSTILNLTGNLSYDYARTLSVTSDGAHHIAVNATDIAGNWRVASVNFTVDTTQQGGLGSNEALAGLIAVALIIAVVTLTVAAVIVARRGQKKQPPQEQLGGNRL